MLASAQQTQTIPIDPAVRIGHLDNGLTYYLRHNEEPAGQANFYIAQKVGSILEEEDQRGLAHFLEHMCFNGTEHFPGNNLIKYCERIGVKFGENLNAYTSIDETVYNIDNVPVAKVPDAVDSCLWILHDWADGLLLEDADIDDERGVIHEEWRSRMNEPQLRMYEVLLPEIYPGNRYGERLPIGLMSVVDNFPYKALRDYYEKWYRPDQQGIIVVGDIDVDEVEAKIKDIFSTIAKPENPAERFYVQIEDNDEPIISVAKDAEMPYAMSYIFCKHEAYPDELKSNLDYLLYQYAGFAANIMLYSRLEEILQSPESPLIGAEIADDMFFLAKTKGAFTGLAASSPDKLLPALTTVYREILRAARGGFTASEYERARAEILSQYETEYKQRDKKKSADYCSEYVSHFIDNEPIPGIETMYMLSQQLCPVIPVDFVNQVIASLVSDNNLVVACMLPDVEGFPYPGKDEIAAAFKSVSEEDIEPYVDAVSDEPLISELPVAGKVVSSSDDAFGYKKYTLSNGATVYLKKTDFNADEILMTAVSEGGKSLYPESVLPNLKALNSVIGLGGIGNFSQTDLTKQLSGKQVYVGTNVGTYNESISGSTTPKDLETMFQMTYLYFTSIRKDDDAFASWKNRQAIAIANRDTQPMTALQDTLYTTIYTHPARVLDITLEDLEKVDYDATLAIAKERFANAADFSFIFTGNFEEETILPLIEQYIASLPSDGKHEKADYDAVDFKKGVYSNIFERSMEVPMVTNCFLYTGQSTYNLEEYLSFNLAMNTLSTYLLDEIREKEGGTYSISATGSMDKFPREQAYFQIVYQTDPDKYIYLNERVAQIVDEFSKNGPSEESLAKAKEFYQKSYLENINENSYWNALFTSYLFDGTDLHTGYESTLESVDVNAVKAAVASVLDDNNSFEVIMVGKEVEK